MKTIVAVMLLLSTVLANAQNAQDQVGDIALYVVLPDNSEGLSGKTISKLESKIQHIITKNGVSGAGYSNDFLIYPKLEIFDESVVEGMRNIVVVEVEFNLFIQQYSNKKLFSSYATSLQGSGFSKQKAIIDAISKIPTDDKEIATFITEAKEKIIDYYNNNCNQIVQESDNLLKSNKFRQAIAVLSSVPKEAAPCYNKVQDKLIRAFNSYQKQTCESSLLKAKTKIANNQYTEALRYLGLIDVSSPCVNRAEKLIKEISNKLSPELKEESDLMVNKLQDGQEKIEQHRAVAIKRISREYHKTSPKPPISYKTLIR